VGGCELDACESGYGPVAGSCEHGNETLGSLKGGEVLDELNDYHLWKENSTP
jgi:hypothetical protein